jgi:hypothetical protein
VASREVEMSRLVGHDKYASRIRTRRFHLSFSFNSLLHTCTSPRNRNLAESRGNNSENPLDFYTKLRPVSLLRSSHCDARAVFHSLLAPPSLVACNYTQQVDYVSKDRLKLLMRSITLRYYDSKSNVPNAGSRGVHQTTCLNL